MIASVPTKGVVDRMIEILEKTEAALCELHYYYKFGRYSEVFPEKPYFLFSHCAHLLFSLWMIEADGQEHSLKEDSRLNQILQSLDFNTLRYTEYKRRVLHADNYEEHLQNEPIWFKFWIRALDVLDPSTASQSKVFTKTLLECAMQGEFMGGQLNARRKQLLNDMIRSAEAGRLILHSIWVLEDVASAIAAYVSESGARESPIAQMHVLTGLMQRLRRTVVLESGAKGPYALFADRTWGVPSGLARFCCKHVPVLLVVAPRDEGGAINCTCGWTSGKKRKNQRWTQDTSCLTNPYEEMLFKTWSYDTGEYLADAQDMTQQRACWLIEDLEANHLETISQHADHIIAHLASYPTCEAFVETLVSLLRDGRSLWEAGKLRWTYIKQLDQLINRLRFVCREAKVLGGDNPVPAVVARLWPSQRVPTGEANPLGSTRLAAAQRDGHEPRPRGRQSPHLCERATDQEVPFAVQTRKEPENRSEPSGKNETQETPAERECRVVQEQVSENHEQNISGDEGAPDRREPETQPSESAPVQDPQPIHETDMAAETESVAVADVPSGESPATTASGLADPEPPQSRDQPRQGHAVSQKVGEANGLGQKEGDAEQTNACGSAPVEDGRETERQALPTEGTSSISAASTLPQAKPRRAGSPKRKKSPTRRRQRRPAGQKRRRQSHPTNPGKPGR